MKIKRLSCILTLCTALLLSSCGESNTERAADTAPATNGGAFIGGAAEDGFAAESPTDGGALADREFYSSADASASGADSVGDYEYSASEETAATDDYKAEEEYYIESPASSQSQAHAGLLTSGEWSDNKNYSFWTDLLTTRQEWSYLPTRWNLNTLNRVAVTVTSGQAPAENITVKLLSGNTVIWESVTDNSGTAYLFSDFDSNNQYLPTKVVAEYNGVLLAEAEYSQGGEISLEVQSQSSVKGLDLMFMIDTTGSMGDELSYLQTELTNIVDRVVSKNNIPVRISVNFYRDVEDDYVVRSFEFTDNISSAVRDLNNQYASGGGDYEEAVEEALADAVYNHSWDNNNTKLMFLVLDAPPHYTSNNADALASTLAEASAEGIRIIPVASSGVDTETEFLCRTFAVATGGTYTFLTDHSGVGGSHLEPTIGYYQVEKLNDMIVRIIESYIE